MQKIPFIQNSDEFLYNKLISDYMLSIKKVFSYIKIPLFLYVSATLLFWISCIYMFHEKGVGFFDLGVFVQVFTKEAETPSWLTSLGCFGELGLQAIIFWNQKLYNAFVKCMKINSCDFSIIEKKIAQYMVYSCLSCLLKNIVLCFSFFQIMWFVPKLIVFISIVMNWFVILFINGIKYK